MASGSVCSVVDPELVAVTVLIAPGVMYRVVVGSKSVLAIVDAEAITFVVLAFEFVRFAVFDFLRRVWALVGRFLLFENWFGATPLKKVGPEKLDAIGTDGAILHVAARKRSRASLFEISSGTGRRQCKAQLSTIV